MASNLAGSIGIDDACLTAGLSSQLTFWYKYMKRLTGREDTQNLFTFGVLNLYNLPGLIFVENFWLSIIISRILLLGPIPSDSIRGSPMRDLRWVTDGENFAKGWHSPAKNFLHRSNISPPSGPNLTAICFPFPTKNLQNITSRTDFTQNRKEYQSNSIKCQN